MSWSAVLLSALAGSGWLAFGLITLRMSGVKRDRDKADAARKEQAAELLKLATKHTDYRQRLTLQLKDLENEIDHLETELDNCDTPGARRNTLNRLLQKASSARSDAEHSLLN